MDHAFLVETYASERLKTLSVWSMFADGDLTVRPHRRWFVGMLGSTSARRHGGRRRSGWRSSAATPTTRATGLPPSGPRTPRGGRGGRTPRRADDAAAPARPAGLERVRTVGGYGRPAGRRGADDLRLCGRRGAPRG